MLHTKFRGSRPTGSGEEGFLRAFTIYGCGGHFGIVNKISMPLPKEAPHLIGQAVSEKIFEIVNGDGRTTVALRMQDHTYTLSSL